MRIAFYNLGCKLNQCESEALASSFGSQGFFVVPPTEEADIYLVNTCTVTSKSEQKARRMIRKFARENPSSLVIVTGCYAQMEPELFESLGPGVRVVAGSRKARLLELPHYLNQTGCAAAFVDEGLATLLGRDAQTAVGDQEASHQEAFNFDAERFSSHSRAFLKIQDGCDNRCTYCRVTLARGDAVSLEASEALRRAQRLEAAGFDEIILTGLISPSTRSGEYDLGGLAGALIDGTSRVRYRLSSIEPDYLTADNIEKLTHERICPHFHLPIQAGDNTVLRRMGRRYRSAQVVEGVRRLREAGGIRSSRRTLSSVFPARTRRLLPLQRSCLPQLRRRDCTSFPTQHGPERLPPISNPGYPSGLPANGASDCVSSENV